MNRDPEMISITSAPEAPPPRIRILDSRSREVETVRIGDKLTFRIEIPEDSKLWEIKNEMYIKDFFIQLPTEYLREAALPWPKIPRAHSKLSTTKVAPWIQAFSLLLHLTEMPCNRFTKLSDLLNLTALFSNVTSNIA